MMTRTATRAGVVVATALVAGLTAAGCSAAPPASSTAPGPTTAGQSTSVAPGPATPAPETTTASKSVTYSGVYQVGSCLRLTGDTKYLVPPVPCAQEHEEEVFGFIEFPDGGLLEGDALQKFLRSACDQVFTQYVGMGERESKYGWYAATPSKGSYERGDREGMCVAFTDIHDIRNIPVITGSIKGANA